MNLCVICGAEFIEPVGFVEPHYHPCTNLRHGWNWTKEWAGASPRIIQDFQWVPEGEIERARGAAQRAAELGLL